MSSLDVPLAHVLLLALSNRGLGRDRADGTETRVPDLETFRHALRHLTVKYLRGRVDRCLVAWDEAAAQGDSNAIEGARAEWNAIWEEIDRRKAIASKVAS